MSDRPAPPPPPSIEELQAIIGVSPFHEFCQVEVVDADPETETITLRVPMRPEFERRAGTGQWHGGPIASLIDSAGDYALVFRTGAGVPTINYRVDYLRPAMNTALTATARLRRAGRTVGVVDIDVVDDEGRLVAVGRGCYSAQVG